MKTQAEAYDICRCYLEDNSSLLQPDLRLRLHGYIRARDAARLAGASDLFNPQLHGLVEFRILRQVSAFFKKNVDFSVDEACRGAAILAFNEAEEQCRETNHRLDLCYAQQGSMTPDLRLHVSRMEKQISRLLGNFDEFLAILPETVKITSGASASRSRRHSLPPLKLRRRIECSSGAVPYLKALAKFYGYSSVRWATTPVNRVEFVPKNLKTHRTIACEPEGNIPLQLAFDAYMKKRLRRYFAVDLSSQVLNQELALEGSVSGEFATIDLSAASDTLAFNTVAWFLPKPWFDYVNAIRSTHYVCPESNRFMRYQKFSSMGNGSTFSLETLIFAAAVRAVGSQRYAVYGDDIVIETKFVEPLTALLSFLGFTINKTKSYASGPFRESCGTDWYNGENVTPFYLREWGRRKSILSHNVNGLAAVSLPGGKLWQLLKALIIERQLALVPFNSDTMSGVFIDVQACYSKKLLRFRNWTPYFRAYLVKQPTRRITDSRTLFLWHLDAHRGRHVINNDMTERVSSRDRKSVV